MKLSILCVVDREHKLERMVIVVESVGSRRPWEGNWKRRAVLFSTERMRFVGIEK